MSDPTDKPGRGRPRKRDKDEVAALAMHAYWADGPTEVSLNAVCARAGVSKPSVYRDFGNEDGLVHAALGHYAQTVLAKMLEITDSGDDFAIKIKRIAHLICEDSLHENGCLFVKMRAVRGQMGPQTRVLIDQIEAVSLDALTDVMTQARASGDWPGPVPVSLGAAYFQAQIGLALDMRVRGLAPRPVLELALSALIPAKA